MNESIALVQSLNSDEMFQWDLFFQIFWSFQKIAFLGKLFKFLEKFISSKKH